MKKQILSGISFAALALLAVVFSAAGKGDEPTPIPHPVDVKCIVLVHGAWLDASCWERVVPALKAAGHEVITVNLPGHGIDNTAFSAITMQTYVDAVKSAIGNRTDVVLVGHSMGGLVISQTAEQIPVQISKLVYLGAFLPRNGESLLGLSGQPENAQSLLGVYFRPDEKTGSGSIAKEGLVETFAADAPEAISALFVAHHKADALAPFVTPVSLTDANFGSIPKAYIYTTFDKAIACAMQQRMVDNNKTIQKTYAVPSSHTPFYSMPEVIASILLHESEPPPPLLEKSSPAQLVEALHSAFGQHLARAVHAKGIILEGKFTPDVHAAGLTTAFHMQKQESKVIVRFSDFTGIPDIPDNIAAANPRGLAIKFIMPDGRNTDIVGHSFNGFPTENSDQFRELLLAIAASGNDAPKPTPLAKFLETHPVAKTFLTTQHTPVSYGSINYFGVNSFKFMNSKGASQYVRYQFVPEKGEELLTPEQIAKVDPDYLAKEIRERVAKHPIRYKIYVELAENGDKIEDPSIAWPNERKKVLLGVIEIQKVSSNTPEEDKNLSFSPNNIPNGIETADPMLNFRGKTYPISVKERQK
jgi:catalase